MKIKKIEKLEEVHKFKTDFIKAFLAERKNFSNIINKGIKNGIEIEGFF